MSQVSIGYLRHLAEIAPRDEDREQFTAAADEIERLRALINAYIDAEQALTRYTVLGTHKRNPDTVADLDADVDVAYRALRKAVGR